jgi:hypothetical protein
MRLRRNGSIVWLGALFFSPQLRPSRGPVACLATSMLRSIGLVVALCLSTAACDSEVARVPDAPDDVLSAEPEARVGDCVRTADGVPIAILSGADPFSLATDGASLFYMSDGRIFSIALAGGAAKPLIPNGFVGGDVKYADGFVYWLHDDTVYRVTSSGGEPEPLVELGAAAEWDIAGDAILSTAARSAEPSPLFRSSLTTGETTEILPLDESNPIRRLRVVGNRVLVGSDSRLLSISVFGGDEQLLADTTMSGVDPPLASGDSIYFGAHDKADHFVARASSSDSGEPQRLATGFAVSMVADDEALFVSSIPVPQPGAGETSGELVRVPLDGGAPQRLSAMPTWASSGFAILSAGLVVDDANVYFIEGCTEGKPNEFRLVAVSKQP